MAEYDSDDPTGDMSDINTRPIPNPMSINPAFEVIAQPDGRFVDSDSHCLDINARKFGGGSS